MQVSLFAASAVLLLTLVDGLEAATTFPLFKQCDPRWGNDTMGVPGQLARPQRNEATVFPARTRKHT